jgi:translocation and assembly module TamB
VLQAEGGIVDLPAAALAGWRGVVKQLDVHTVASASASSESKPGATLLRTSDVAFETYWSGGPPRATVQPGRAEILGGALRWSRASWQAASQPGEYTQIEAEAEMEPLRVAPLLARAQPGFGWGGDLTLAGHLKIRSAPTFSADVVIERSTGDLTVTDELDTRALGLTDLRFGLSADNGVWNFTQGLAGKSLGVAAGAVVVRTTPRATWPPADAPIQGVLELQVADLGSWGSWVPPGWRVEGALHSSASIGGRFGAPEYTGIVEGSRLAVRNFLQGVNVSDGDVSIRLQGSTARIERFIAKAGSGSVKLEGDASLGEAPKAVLKLTADKFQLLGRVDRRIVASGIGQLQLDSKTLGFDGKFNVDDGLIDFTRSDAPTLSDDVEVVRARGVPSPAAAASAAATAEAATIAPKPSREVALDLRVNLGERLRVRGRGLDTGLRGELHITSPGGRLAVDGTVRAVDGTYAAYGQKLSIDRGNIMFNGAIENPRLDIEATRPNIDVRVGVAVSGTAANPRVRLFSEPELSDIDKLSWLVMGRASEGLGRGDTALLQRAALALLSGEGGGPTEQFTKALGLDDISVRQQTDGEVRETVIALGKQLSRRWYVGYERGLNATTGSFQLVYRIAQRFTLRAQSGQDNSLDLIWTWRWH